MNSSISSWVSPVLTPVTLAARMIGLISEISSSTTNSISPSETSKLGPVNDL